MVNLQLLEAVSPGNRAGSAANKAGVAPSRTQRRPYPKAVRQQRASMDSPRRRDDIGARSDVRAQCDAGARNENPRFRDASTEIERNRPTVVEAISYGTTKQVPDLRESPCIV